MQGFYDLRVLDAPAVREAELRALLTPAGKATPELDRLLARLPLARRVRGRNLVLDHLADFVFNQMMSGPAGEYPYNYDGSSAFLATLALETTDSEPTYQESSAGNWYPYSTTNIVTSDAYKRFIEDDVEPHNVRVAVDGREAVEVRSRFLFTQSQAVSSNIRSVGIWFANDADSTSYVHRGRACRIRLKDSGGTPIVVSKTGSQILVMEYTFVLVTI